MSSFAVSDVDKRHLCATPRYPIVPELTTGERERLRAVLEGLALAIDRSDEIDDASVEKTGEVKVQKLLYEALAAHDELDDVTHSWYIAGAKADVPSGEFGVDHLVDAYGQLARPTGDESAFVERREQRQPSDDAQKYASYFEGEFGLDDVWFTSTVSYLLDFYREEAPAEYRDVYVAVQELRIELRKTVGKLVDFVGDDSQANLDEFGQETPVLGPDRYDRIADVVSEVHLELADHEQLQHTLPVYRAFTDVLEDAYLALSKLEVGRLDGTQIQAFKALGNFHYYEAWKLPSLVISMETATGPRADDLQVRRARELESHREGLRDGIRDIRRTCSDAGLVPAVADYSVSDADDELLDGLIELYVGRRE